MSWILLIAGIILLITCISYAQAWEDNYDPNTEISIKGKISEVIIREKGLVIIGVARQDKIYFVLTAPKWYIEQEKIELKNGDELIIYGAKFFSKSGERFLIAREIHNISKCKIYPLRDESLRPFWRGRGKNRMH